MMNEAVEARVIDLFADKEFAQKFTGSEDFAEMQSLFIEYGVEISDDELKTLIETMLAQIEQNADTELSEDQMDKVAGGFVEWIIAGGVAAVVCGVSAYKLRKALNSINRSCK